MAPEPMLDETESAARRSPPDDGPDPGRQPGAAGLLLIDAGTRHFRLRSWHDDGSPPHPEARLHLFNLAIEAALALPAQRTAVAARLRPRRFYTRAGVGGTR